MAECISLGRASHARALPVDGLVGADVDLSSRGCPDGNDGGIYRRRIGGWCRRFGCAYRRGVGRRVWPKDLARPGSVERWDDRWIDAIRLGVRNG